MFIRNIVPSRPSTFSAKNRWSITFHWWQVYRTTDFRCCVFPLLICRDLSSRSDACADVKYTHTHTNKRYTYIMKMHLHIKRQSEHWTLVLWWGGNGMGGENNWFLIRPPRKENFMPHHQNDGQNYNTKLRYTRISSENRAGSRYYETALQDC